MHPTEYLLLPPLYIMQPPSAWVDPKQYGRTVLLEALDTWHPARYLGEIL